MSELIAWIAGVGSGTLLGALAAGPAVYRYRLRRTLAAMQARQRETVQYQMDQAGLPELGDLVRQAQLTEHERIASTLNGWQ